MFVPPSRYSPLKLLSLYIPRNQNIKQDMKRKRFTLNGGAPKYLGEIAAEIVLDYANKHPFLNAQQIRDIFVTVCRGVKVASHIVETEAEYHLRDWEPSQERSSEEITIPSGEKLYVSTQWHAGKPGDDFYNFMEIVHGMGWGKIVKLI